MPSILFIVEDLDIGGTEKALCKWLRHFNRERFKGSVVSFKDGILRKDMEESDISVDICTKAKAWDLGFLIKLIRKIKAINPDLVHCRNGMRAIIYGGIAARLCRKPLITSIHGRTHYLKINFRTRIWFWVIRLSDIVITVSEGIKEEVSKIGKVSRDKIRVIYNGIEVEEIKNEKYNRKDIELNKNDFVIGTVGSLREIKGHRYLIKAMPLILEKITNAKLVLIGEGKEDRNLKKLADELNLNGCVKFLGYKENAQKLMGIFDVFILPSLSEGFPNVLLEAGINKKPIVATRVGGIEEILKDSYSALLVDKGDSEMLAEKVVQIKNDSKLADRLKQNAYKDVINNFGIESFVKAYEEAYLAIKRC